MKKSLVGVVLGLVTVGGADASIVSRGFFEEQIGNYATLDLLNSKANQKDLTALNDIVGKENWDIVLNLKFKDFPHLSELFPNLAPDKGMPIPDISNYIYGNLTYTGGPNLAGVTDKFLHGWTNSDGETYLGLKDINTKIGTLPSGKINYGPALNILIGNLEYIYPNDLAGIYGVLFGTEENIGIIDMLSDNILNGPAPDIKGLRILTSDINEIAAKIGTVPDGKNFAGMISETDAKIGVLAPDTTVAGMMGNPVLLNREQTIIPLYDLILWGSNGQIVANPISGAIIPFPLLGLLDITAKVNKIGDLPTEYATVGAALEAINAKVDNKITNLSATASNGKYVLTAVKEGDQTTYAWESIDRSESETTTTE